MTNQLNIPLSIKSHREDGFFCGYASVFDVTDHHQEIVSRQAFRQSLQNWRGKGRLPKMLWQHDQRKPVGIWEDIYEDEHGLFVKGRILLDIEAGREAYALMKAGVIDSLSIGFRPVRALKDPEKNIRILKEVDLLEISLVTFAANPDAKITVVKEFAVDEDIVRQIGEISSLLRSHS